MSIRLRELDLEPAEICRKRGWTVGTILEGDEGYGPERILVTAIGEEAILARRVSNQKGVATDDNEGLWTLDCRDWKPVCPCRCHDCSCCVGKKP